MHEILEMSEKTVFTVVYSMELVLRAHPRRKDAAVLHTATPPPFTPRQKTQ
jgi:hypothetical protein